MALHALATSALLYCAAVHILNTNANVATCLAFAPCWSDIRPTSCLPGQPARPDDFTRLPCGSDCPTSRSLPDLPGRLANTPCRSGRPTHASPRGTAHPAVTLRTCLALCPSIGF